MVLGGCKEGPFGMPAPVPSPIITGPVMDPDGMTGRPPWIGKDGAGSPVKPCVGKDGATTPVKPCTGNDGAGTPVRP